MFKVMTVRNTGSKYDCYITSVCRANLTKEEAIAIKAKKMANPNRSCEYVIVADSRLDEFYAKIADRNAKVGALKAKRWAEMDAMVKKGYRVTDAIAYLNR